MATLQVQPVQQAQQPQPQVIVQQASPHVVYVSNINPSWPVRSKIAAGLLAIFLGTVGVHKFYLGRIGMGIIYILFSWTGIPSILGFIEGIVYLWTSDENFQLKHHVRIE